MGRAKLAMDDDGPGADDCKMPGFISSFEEGRAKLPRSLPTQTSIADGKVVRPVGHLRSNSRLSPDRGPGERSSPGEGGRKEEEAEEEEEEERDEEGNNNNNCNGGGGAGRRASAAEILRRNFGDLRSPSLRAHGSGRMQHDTRKGSVNADAGNDHGSECGECKKKSDGEAVGAGAQNEPTSSELVTSDVEGVVEYLKNVGKCDGEAGRATPGESGSANEHIYCTVYCIANDGLLKEAELPHRHHEAAASTATDVDSVSGRGAGSSPEPSLYTVDDLVDPFGDLSYRLFNELSGTEAAVRSCRVCLEETTIASLSCCRKAVCDECLKLYVSPQVRMGKVYISCPIPECNGNLEEGVVIAHLAKENVAKYQYFLELSQLDSSTKPCPHCSHFTSLKAQNPNHSEHKYKIQCSNCQFVWCFKCHAPWHNGIKCRDYRRGDKLLRTWASVIEDGQRNAQKCPQCKIHIQRTEGCDHMTCAQCNTNFCYRCGERYRHLRFFGDHTSNLSVFGCKYRYLPDKPHLRRLVRGSVCATKVLIAPVVILLVVVLGALALVIGLVVFPVYYVFKRRKKQHSRGSGRWI